MAYSPFTTTMKGPAAVQLLNYLADLIVGVIPVAYAATITLDFTQWGSTFGPIAMTGPLTLGFSGPGGVALGDASLEDFDGKKFQVLFKQDATGSRLLTPASTIGFGSDIPSVTLTTTANKLDRVGYQYNHAAAKCDVIGYVRGFAG